MDDEERRKIALIYDIHFQKNVADDLSKEFQKFCNFKLFSIEDVLNEIHKFKPDFIFYLRNLRTDIHRNQFVKDKDYKCRTVCWILDDPIVLNETQDIGVFYNYVFTADLFSMTQRQELRYKNIYYLPLDANNHVQQIVEIIFKEK